MSSQPPDFKPTEDLLLLGWGPFFQEAWKGWSDTDYRPARVAAEYRTRYWVALGGGDTRPARVSGRLRHLAGLRSDFPAVGDWVAVAAPEAEGEVVIHGILPRKSKFSRKVVGVQSEEQVLAANLDTVFLMMGLDGDYNQRRLERFLAVAYESGAKPVVVLTKTDISPSLKEDLAECRALSPDTPVHAICAPEGRGLEELKPYLASGRTVVLLGASGVGKSTLLNQLLGEEAQDVQEVRERDSRGRHTTTNRQMFRLPLGALVIDTPGLRELQFWGGDAGMADAFEDILALGLNCKFRNCRHGSEPGCAVRLAMEEGRLDEERYDSFLKLKREQAFLESRVDKKAAREHHKAKKAVHEALKKAPKRGRIEGV